MVYYLSSIFTRTRAFQTIALDVDGVESRSKSTRLMQAASARTMRPSRYKIVLNSDSKSFDGLSRVQDNQVFLTEDQQWDERPFSFKVASSSSDEKR